MAAPVYSTIVQKYLGHVSTYDRAFKKWESRADKIQKKYRDERSERSKSAQFNILWSNVQTLSAATFARLPKPDVSRRFRDNDPVGRVASLLLERALDYEVQHYPDYRATLKASVLDRFLGGRAVAWARYEPHFKAQQLGQPTNGLEITEDIDPPGEELDYECSPTDYVHWRDFGHNVARSWEEVFLVWRHVYMSKEACIERFGEEIAKKIPLDATPEELKRNDNGGDGTEHRACIIELWDKTTKKAIWLSKGLPDPLDEKDDPLGLEEFFPCPRPLYATLTNDTLVPIPDYTLYQDQAQELDVLCDRIDGLVKGLKVMGCYDASLDELKRLFTEGDNTTMFPITNYAAYSEKGGSKGAIDLVDITPLARALVECYKAFDQIKGQVYEITGVSDIIRGQTDAGETATAQGIKAQYASLRLKSYQEEVAIYATQILQLKAQIMCRHFSADTLLKISAADQLSEQDQQLIPQAMQLLIGDRAMNPEAESKNPLRSFRIDIAADSLVMLDEQAEKNSAVEFVTANGQFMEQAMKTIAGAGPAGPVIAPLVMELWKFAVTRFKVGKAIEGQFDETAEKLKQVLSQPPAPPPPDPALQVAQIKAGAEQAKTQAEMQLMPMKVQAEQTKAQADVMMANTALQTAVVNANAPQMRPQ